MHGCGWDSAQWGSQRAQQRTGCHYAISELCKDLYHHNGVWHESPRPQIHRFRPQARAPPLGVRQ